MPVLEVTRCGHTVKDDTGPKQTRIETAGVLALVVLLGCLVASGWTLFQFKTYDPFIANDYFPSLPDSNEAALVESNASFRFPPSARDIYTYTTGFRDISVQVRFSMNPGELDEFLAGTLCQEPLQEIEVSPLAPSSETAEWWTPDQANRLQGCTGRNDHSYQRVMVDLTDPAVFTVFVITLTP